MSGDRYVYAGWVPTITGHLSFSLIGVGSDVVANALCAESHAAGTPCRYVAISKKRVTTDLPYNGWPVGALMPSTKAEYVLLGHTSPAPRPSLSGGEVSIAHDEIGVLTGEIWIVPHHADGRARKLAEAFVSQLRAGIASFGDRNPRGAAGEISGVLASAHRKLADARSKGIKVLVAEFALFRTGEFRLALRAGGTTGAPPISPEAADPIARQMYYFAKDMAHRHYHHVPSTDNLLPLVPADEDDTDWRRETLWALVRAVLEARRRNHLQSYKSALGIVAYAEAFQSLLAQIRWKAPGEDTTFTRWTDATLYDFSHTRSSLEATINEREFIETSSDAFKSVIIATGLGAAALWVGLVQIAPNICGLEPNGRLMCPPSPAVTRLIREAILHPSLVLLGVMFVGGLWYGRRFLTLNLTQGVTETLDAWGVALGASLSRWVRKRTLGYSDLVGAFGSAAIVGLAGVAAILALARLFRFY